jgi:hypothetical protein
MFRVANDVELQRAATISSSNIHETREMGRVVVGLRVVIQFRGWTGRIINILIHRAKPATPAPPPSPLRIHHTESDSCHSFWISCLLLLFKCWIDISYGNLANRNGMPFWNSRGESRVAIHGKGFFVWKSRYTPAPRLLDTWTN